MRHECRLRNVFCNFCGIKGHIARVCQGKAEGQESTHLMEEFEEPSEYVEVIEELRGIEDVNAIKSMEKHMIDVKINNHTLKMELDTGAPCGIVSQKLLSTLAPNCVLLQTKRQFASYTGHPIRCIGYVSVVVSMGTTSRQLNLFVVDGDYKPLFGREWIQEFVDEIDFRKLFIGISPIHSSTGSPFQVSHSGLDRGRKNFKRQVDEIRSQSGALNFVNERKNVQIKKSKQMRSDRRIPVYERRGPGLVLSRSPPNQANHSSLRSSISEWSSHRGTLSPRLRGSVSSAPRAEAFPILQATSRLQRTGRQPMRLRFCKEGCRN